MNFFWKMKFKKLVSEGKLTNFFDYFIRQRVKQTPFPSWNVLKREGSTRTTNICESWNASWKMQLGTMNENLWKVIKAWKFKSRVGKTRLGTLNMERIPPCTANSIENSMQKHSGSKTDFKMDLMT